MKNQTYQKIIQKFEDELSFIINELSYIISKAEKAIGLCSLALLEMREIVKEYGFQEETKEIHFFKHVKPKVYSKLLFFHELFKIETKRPKSIFLQKRYLKGKLKEVNRYFKINYELCLYYRNDKSHSDELYFLRKNRNLIVHPDTIFSYIDNEFSTLHDYTFSSILAHEELVKYIENEILQLEQIELREKNNPSSEYFVTTGIKWTGSKISLIELIYALHSTNSINNGNIDLKELVKFSEQLFNIKLGDYSRTYLDIRMRKTGRTKFLDTLKQSLLKRMEDADE